MTKTGTRRNNSNSRHRQAIYQRPIFWVTLVILVAVGTGAYFLVNHLSQSEPSPEHTSLNIPTTTDEDKSNSSENTPSQKEDMPEDKVIRYDGENPNNLENLTGFITRKSNVNGTLTIVASLDQYIEGSGTCTLTLKGKTHGQTYTATTNIIPEATTSVCEVFTIPVSSLGLPRDNYQITIQFSGGNKTGLIEDGVEL